MMLVNNNHSKANRGIKAGIIVLVLFLLFFTLPNTAAGASERMDGDIVGNEAIDVNDLVLAMQIDDDGDRTAARE